MILTSFSEASSGTKPNTKSIKNRSLSTKKMRSNDSYSKVLNKVKDRRRQSFDMRFGSKLKKKLIILNKTNG